jgi:hypothetical protein
MGLPIRDDRQRKALPGVSHDPCHHWLPVFSDLSQAPPQHTDEAGRTAGTRVRPPGGGGTGTVPTMAEKRLCVLSSYQTSPPFDVLGTPVALVRSTAKEPLQTFSPL